MDISSINILSILQPELIILIPVCWGIGLLLKSTKVIKNKYIPFILAAFSVAMACLYTFAVDGASNIAMSIFMSIAQGIGYWIIAWVSYDKGIKCAMKKNSSDDSDKG